LQFVPLIRAYYVRPSTSCPRSVYSSVDHGSSPPPPRVLVDGHGFEKEVGSIALECCSDTLASLFSLSVSTRLAINKVLLVCRLCHRKQITNNIFRKPCTLLTPAFCSLSARDSAAPVHSDCTRTPLALQEEIMKGVLKSTGITSPKQVHIVSENEISSVSPKHTRHHQVAQVGHKIICAARDYVQGELQKALDNVQAQMPPDVSEKDFFQQCETDETVQYWYDARLRLQGEDSLKKKPWQYVFIESNVPNAFVTEMLPQRFFITTAMLKVAETPDELAIVLGHETSHLVLGHISQTNKVETFLRTIEILLLTLDPTEGVLSVLVVAGLAGVHKALVAAHSRESEREADELGLILAARACFDTHVGSHVLYKMHQMSVAPTSKETARQATSKHARAQLLDTHPPTLDRWEFMKEQSATENYTKYQNAQCKEITNRFYKALWGSSSRGGNE
jgi:Zn-dependent protease with chaperone function